MRTVKDVLRDADPLLHEPDRLALERERLRQAVIAAGSGVTTRSSERVRARLGLWVTVALLAIGSTVLGSRIWLHGSATLQAAIRFEVRLAEDRPGAGLIEARVADRVVYLHPEIIVTNGDIAQSTVIPGDGPSRFAVSVQFNAAGARKMRQATAGHVGRPVAILIDGNVVMAPTLRSPIGASAVITGDYTRAEAERIVNGIGLR